MAGRPLSAARAIAEAERITKARELPTEPREEPATYSPEIIPELLALSDLGLTPAEIAAHWNVTEADLTEWAETHAPFKAAVARARTRSKAWWERSARLAMAERDTRYPAGLFSHVMRARYTEYDDKPQGLVLDLSGLVLVNLRDQAQLAGLPAQQTVIDAKPLSAHTTAILGPGQTASDGVETSALQGASGGPDLERQPPDD
jgi:hypothetical protein